MQESVLGYPFEVSSKLLKDLAGSSKSGGRLLEFVVLN